MNGLSLVPGRVGGGETYLANLLRAMAPRLAAGEKLVVICSRAGVPLFSDLPREVERLVVPLADRGRGARLLLEHLLLPVLLPARGVDVLLSPGNAIPLFAGVRHVLALQSMHYLYVPHQMSRWRVRYFRTLVPLSALRAARVLCMSEDLRRSLLSVAPRARPRAEVVPEGADLGLFAPPPAPGGGREGILYVSSLNPFKRPDSVVRALALLRREGFPPPPLRMLGRPDPEDRRRVEELARREGVADLVRIEGVVGPRELAERYRRAACLVYPSVLETFGLPPLEAMACGCPVVASNRSSVPEVVGDAALTVDPDDVPALAGALRRVLSEPDLRARLRRRGFRRAARFDWGRTAARTLAALRGAAGPAGARGG